jgi:ABC-type uncharacterized transport system substrate-binding protein
VARSLGLEVATFEIRRAEDIVPAFESLKDHADALYVTGDALLNANRIRINTLALGARLPTMRDFRESVADVNPPSVAYGVEVLGTSHQHDVIPQTQRASRALYGTSGKRLERRG